MTEVQRRKLELYETMTQQRQLQTRYRLLEKLLEQQTRELAEAERSEQNGLISLKSNSRRQRGRRGRTIFSKA
jgi:hypothetical protein